MNEVERIKNLRKSILLNNTIFLPKDKADECTFLLEAYEEFFKGKRNEENLAMSDKSFEEAESGGFITKEV